MKSLRYIVISLFLFIISCEKNEPNLKNLNYELLDFFSCPSCYEFRDKEYIIRDTESYQNLQDSASECYILCENLQFPEIDFNQYSLIGKYTGVGACNTSYKREFILDQVNSKYIYKIEIEYSGGCDSKRENMNWIKVLKLNNNDSVDFQVKYINGDE